MKDQRDILKANCNLAEGLKEPANIDLMPNLPTADENIYCHARNLKPKIIEDCLKQGPIPEALRQELKEYYYFIVKLECTFRGNLKSGEFQIKFKDKVNIKIEDVYPKDVKIESVKKYNLGVNSQPIFVEKTDPEEVIHFYGELNPVIYHCWEKEEPDMCWCFEGNKLFGTTRLHMIIKVPKKMPRIFADLKVKGKIDNRELYCEVRPNVDLSDGFCQCSGT
jgi:hypothetical protein